MPKCPIIRTRFEDNEFFEDIADKKKTAKKSDNPKSIKEILKEMKDGARRGRDCSYGRKN